MDSIDRNMILNLQVMKSTTLRQAGHVARMEEVKGAFKPLSDKLTGMKLLGRSRSSWEDSIRIYIKAIGEIRGIGLIQTRVGIIGEAL